jgi:HPt (histidine-containing phosphotransfer) domain-containing protein
MPKHTVIDWDEAMNQVGGDVDFLNEVLQDLLQESDTAEEEIGNAINDNDFSSIQKAAHRIKGSASYLCCDALKESALSLQDLGNAGTTSSNKPKVMGDIKDEYKNFRFQLKELHAAVKKGHK